ncbi:desmoglein-4-like [Physeter macrocephalus]|uniref:Desmoglein-4-like n=1 Tax=Physeter macrocephalus TaxID=9755 RepID=A0A9W2WAT6_PHYMC|nr:desmoglein-4-like [Physeter catodon]
MVVLEVNSEFIVEVKELDMENGTAKRQTVRRQKREWIKFAAACREGEDNSKRNPIARMALGKQTREPYVTEVPDINDYCPVIAAERETLCLASPSILFSATGINDHSYGSPFTFCAVDEPPRDSGQLGYQINNRYLYNPDGRAAFISLILRYPNPSKGEF